jgi:hypothetical protein
MRENKRLVTKLREIMHKRPESCRRKKTTRKRPTGAANEIFKTNQKFYSRLCAVTPTVEHSRRIQFGRTRGHMSQQLAIDL